MNINEIITKYQVDLKKVGWGMAELLLLHSQGLIKDTQTHQKRSKRVLLIDEENLVQLMRLCS